jgi:hypothetical protein
MQLYRDPFTMHNAPDSASFTASQQTSCGVVGTDKGNTVELMYVSQQNFSKLVLD